MGIIFFRDLYTILRAHTFVLTFLHTPTFTLNTPVNLSGVSRLRAGFLVTFMAERVVCDPLSPRLGIKLILLINGKPTPNSLSCIGGCRAVFCINYSLVTTVKRQTQSDGY